LPANTAACVGGRFDQAPRKDELTEQLRQGPGKAAAQVNAVGENCPPPGLWTLGRIRASVAWLADYSLSGVWRVLQRLGLGLRSASVQQYSPDPDYGLKRKRLERALREATRQPQAVVALFMDEFGYYRWPDPARNWGPNVAERADNNQQWRTIGALNALTGQVDYLDEYIVGRRQLIRFYSQLAQRYARAERVYVIQDNWNIHAHPDVLAALTRWPHLRPVWLPTYAPWLNPIEKLWRWVRQDVLKLHRLVSDWPGLRQRVRDFFKQFQHGSDELLRYVGLSGDGRLAAVIAKA
jgi:transposase